MAFARYWWGDMLTAAYTSLDATQLEATSAADCRTCQDYVNTLRVAKANGRTFHWSSTVTDAQAVPTGTGQDTVVSVAFDQGAYQELDTNGTVVKSAAAMPNQAINLYLTWMGDHWVVKDVRSGK
jgi:hypothetical protein